MFREAPANGAADWLLIEGAGKRTCKAKGTAHVSRRDRFRSAVQKGRGLGCIQHDRADSHRALGGRFGVKDVGNTHDHGPVALGRTPDDQWHDALLAERCGDTHRIDGCSLWAV